MPSPSDLPPWLPGAGAARGNNRRRTPAWRPARAAALAVLLFGGGALTGVWFAGRRAAPAPTVSCPPADPALAARCEPPAAAPRARPSKAKPARGTPARAALEPLPAPKPMDDGERAQALRAFATEKAPELRDCLAEPDRGPPRTLGAAFEIGANGAFDSVQILGAEATAREVRRCYAGHLKRWRFPEALLRGDEKLLVNFVL